MTPDGTAYLSCGAGEPLVLSHGVGMQAGVWRPQMAALSDRFRVVAYDMLGHGRSRLPPAQPALADYADQLLGLLDALGLGSVNVAGHSMGALVALEFALRHPGRTRRVAALNSVYRRSPEQREAVIARAAGLGPSQDPEAIADTIGRWFGSPIPKPLRRAADELRRYLEQADPDGYGRTYRLFASADEAHVGRLPSLRMPTLFMTGEHDANSSPDMSREMAEAVGHAAVEVIADARHMMSVTHVEAVNRGLGRWLDTPTAD